METNINDILLMIKKDLEFIIILKEILSPDILKTVNLMVKESTFMKMV